MKLNNETLEQLCERALGEFLMRRHWTKERLDAALNRCAPTIKSICEWPDDNGNVNQDAMHFLYYVMTITKDEGDNSK